MILQLYSLLYSHVLDHGALDERICMDHVMATVADVQHIVQVLVVLREMGERQYVMGI